jgi:DNA-binding MarR family transcriptional regulator
VPEEPAPEEPVVEESLAESFWMVARRLRLLTREAVAPWSVTPSQARALSVLHRHGDLRPGELAEHLHVAARSATEVVDDLAERGLVERRPDPHDRRATLVHLTGEGSRVAGALTAARTAQAEGLFAVLPPADRAHLARILARLRG